MSYYITTAANTHWIKTDAKSLTAAKSLANKLSQEHCAPCAVAEWDGTIDNEILVLARKQAFTDVEWEDVLLETIKPIGD